jgi:hypothetical protein
MPENQENNNTTAPAEQPTSNSQPNSEEDRQKNLNQAQRKSNLQNKTDQAKNLAKTATPMGALKLMSQVQVTDVLFVIPVSAAVLKDVSDVVIIGSLPGLGTVVSICCSITIGLFTITLGGGGAKKKAKGFINGPTKIVLTLIGGTLVEMLPGVNFVPTETVTAVVVYMMVLSQRRDSAG